MHLLNLKKPRMLFSFSRFNQLFKGSSQSAYDSYIIQVILLGIFLKTVKQIKWNEIKFERQVVYVRSLTDVFEKKMTWTFKCCS